MPSDKPRDQKRDASGPAAASEPTQQAFWRRPAVIVAALAVVAILLVGGSLYTSRGHGSKRTRTASASALRVKTGDPNAVAATGQKLAEVLTPPNDTHTQIRLTKDLGKPVFVVRFEPYGLAAGNTAVIRIDDAKASGGTTLAPEFAQALRGQNLQAAVALDSAALLKTGGTYEGKLTLVDAGEAKSFAIASVRPIK